MRRAAIALAWLAATALPAAVASIFYFGCCVLPFHRELHRVLPMCNVATHAPHHKPPMTAPAKPVPRMAIVPVRPAARIPNTSTAVATIRHLLRNQIAHGALRCDDDVGLHTLFATFLI